MAYEIIQINDNTWRIEDNQHVRFFLLAGSKQAMLIDSGLTVHNAKEIAQELTDLPLILLNTHADPDHIASNPQFDSFYMHEAEKMTLSFFQPETKGMIPVKEGDTFDLGERPLEIIELPGHSYGSIGILDINARVLYSGDPIQDGMIFMFGPARNMDLYRATLKKLDAYRDRFDELYPSHGSIPVKPELIDALYEASGNLDNPEYRRWPMEMHGQKVMCVDTGVAKFLIQ